MEHDRRQRYIGAAIALQALYDNLTEIQAVTLREMFPEESREMFIASDVIQAIKGVMSNHYSRLMIEIAEGKDEGSEG